MNLYKFSCDYSYGALILDKNIVFINKNFNIYNYNNTIITEDRQKEELNGIINRRLIHIYDNPSNYRKTRSGRRYGGMNYINLPILNSVYNQYEIKNFILSPSVNYNHLFKLPDSNFNYDYFMEQFINNYMEITKDINTVFAILLCFFHIDDFNITTNIINNSQFITDANILKTFSNENLVLPQIPITNRKYIINKYQEHVYADKIIKTSVDIYNIINNNDLSKLLYPVNVDIEYTYDEQTKEINRELFLDDGNHRIYTLKRLGYRGLVPCICFDYLPINLL